MDPTSPQNFPSTTQPQRPGWWSRNWKWFVPMGCFTMVALFVVFIAGIMLIVFGALKSTDVYKTALAQAKASPAVTEALGTPLKEGWFLSGKTNVTGSTGEADISIPISGPKGKGTIYAVATKSAGRWTYSTLEVEIKATGTRIPILADEIEAE